MPIKHFSMKIADNFETLTKTICNLHFISAF